MTDREFLASYDPAAFPRVAVAADVVLFTIRDRMLHVVLVRRSEHPGRGRLALPGAFVRADEDVDDSARRALREKAGVDARVRQFAAYGAVERDPRMRIVSIAYMALLPFERVADVISDDRQLVSYREGILRGANGRKLSLPFDHEAIVAGALADLRVHLDISTWSYGLLAPEFTLRELQEVHEAVRGRTLNEPAFRKRLLEAGCSSRPAGVRPTRGSGPPSCIA